MPVYPETKRETALLLKEKGINPTAQRIEIAHLLLHKPQHLSADEILHTINKEYERVSQATVYNTLRLFVDKGVVRELIISADRIFYDSNTTPHHHFIDVETGAIHDIPIACKVIPDLKEFNAEILDVSLVVKGRSRTKPSE